MEVVLRLPGFLPLLIVVWLHILKMEYCWIGSGSSDQEELPGYFA